MVLRLTPTNADADTAVTSSQKQRNIRACFL
jgi:hypothetical protein